MTFMLIALFYFIASHFSGASGSILYYVFLPQISPARLVLGDQPSAYTAPVSVALLCAVRITVDGKQDISSAKTSSSRIKLLPE